MINGFHHTGIYQSWAGSAYYSLLVLICDRYIPTVRLWRCVSPSSDGVWAQAIAFLNVSERELFNSSKIILNGEKLKKLWPFKDNLPVRASGTPRVKKVFFIFINFWVFGIQKVFLILINFLCFFLAFSPYKTMLLEPRNPKNFRLRRAIFPCKIHCL